MKSSAKSGQSQLLIPLLIFISSAMVFATNITLNMTNGTVVTGDFLITSNYSDNFSFPVEVYANTYIGLNADESIVQVYLSMDNETRIENQQIVLYLNGSAFGRELTNSEGLAEFVVPEGDYEIKAVFEGNDSLFLNPSEIEIEKLANETNVSDYEWVSYDIQTDTIKLVGDGYHCTEDSPCSLTEIYEAMVGRGINNIEKYRTFFIFNSGLQIGDGINETWLVSTSEHILIKKPWEVMPNANLRFGILEDEEYARNGVFFETNVSEEDQLENGTALKVNENASLYFYQSSYKIFSDAENNINQDENSNFHAVRFDVQRIQSKNDVKTEVKIPDNATVEDYVERDKIDYVYSNETSYKNGGMGQ